MGTRAISFYEAPDESLSLYSIVWLPGQWTPVHDHGSWGIVGVVEGVLEERSYVRLSPDRGADADIDLVRGGTILLRHGAVTSFVPNPDHIHMTGVPAERPRAVSLHLYGRMMSDFNIYDVGGADAPAHQRGAQRELAPRRLPQFHARALHHFRPQRRSRRRGASPSARDRRRPPSVRSR